MKERYQLLATAISIIWCPREITAEKVCLFCQRMLLRIFNLDMLKLSVYSYVLQKAHNLLCTQLAFMIIYHRSIDGFHLPHRNLISIHT
jgi:hypothetical protein